MRQSADELSLAELEALLETRRRIERAQALERPARSFRSRGSFPQAKRPTQSDLRDRLLLLVEIAAAVVCAYILIVTQLNLQTLNQQVTQARAAEVERQTQGSGGAIELPGNPFPPRLALPKELPGSSFPPADDSFPPALSLNVKPSKLLPPPPTLGPQAATRIVIPAIGVDWPVVEGDDWAALKIGVGHRAGTPNPGTRGNMVLSGHNDVYGEVFKNLEFLGLNEDVLIYSESRMFRYVTRVRRIVAPTDLTPLDPARRSIVTLITCWPYRVDTYRLILVAELAP